MAIPRHRPVSGWDSLTPYANPWAQDAPAAVLRNSWRVEQMNHRRAPMASAQSCCARRTGLQASTSRTPSLASTDTNANHREDTRDGIPSPSKHTLAQISDVLPPISLFDASTEEIRALAASALPYAEQLERLARLLTPGTNAISISRLLDLLSWPALQSAWARFANDVLLAPAPVAAPAPKPRDPNRFSTILLSFSGTPAPPPPPPAHLTPKWRPLTPSKRRPLLSLGRSLSLSFSLLPGRLNPNQKNPTTTPTQEETSSPDLGLPHPRLLARTLLSALQPSHLLTPSSSLATTNPVNPVLLSVWQRGHWTSLRSSKEKTEKKTGGIEEYYARFMLTVISALYRPVEGEEERWREEMRWLRDGRVLSRGGVREQMWIVFHVLYFLHCRKREEIRKQKGKGGWLRDLCC